MSKRKLKGMSVGSKVRLTIVGSLEYEPKGCKCNPRPGEWMVNGWYIGSDFDEDYKLERIE